MPGYAFKEINEPNYSIQSFDEMIGVKYTTQGTGTITLPKIEEVGLRCYTVTDIGGNASEFPISIQTETGDKIENGTTRFISTDFGSLTVFNDGETGWYINSKNI